MEVCLNNSMNKRGLRQGYSMASFLFLLVAKGFGGLLMGASRRNMLSR